MSALLSQVKVPTLVMHARNDARVPFELGRRMAAGIPGARFVPLESANHIMLEGEPALERFLEELKAFIEPRPGADLNAPMQDKPLNALHNPVTLPVVCGLTLLRS